MNKPVGVNVDAMSPRDFRNLVRKGEWTEPNLSVCPGYAAADLIVVPRELAFDLAVFCQRNPKPCFLLDVTEVGSPHPSLVARDADLRTDLPRYQVYSNGEVIDEPDDVTKYWRGDLVAFLLGCSSSLSWLLRVAGVGSRTTGGYTSNISCLPAGTLRGKMVVSCRLFATAHDAVRAVQISSRHLHAHGAPVHIGDPSSVGIEDLCQPDGEYFSKEIKPQQPNEIAMFWGAGASTMRKIAIDLRFPFMIINYPRCVFITDKRADELAVL